MCRKYLFAAVPPLLEPLRWRVDHGPLEVCELLILHMSSLTETILYAKSSTFIVAVIFVPLPGTGSIFSVKGSIRRGTLRYVPDGVQAAFSVRKVTHSEPGFRKSRMDHQTMHCTMNHAVPQWTTNYVHSQWTTNCTIRKKHHTMDRAVTYTLST
jgi:hypothetical protein